MGLEIPRALSVGAIQPNIYIGRNYNIGFGNQLNADKFENNSIDRYTSEYAIKKMINANPKIKKIVKDFNPNLELNITGWNQLKNNHLKDVQNIARGITENLPFSLKSRVDENAVEKAAYLHDSNFR